MTTYKLSIWFGKTSIQLKSTDVREIDETLAALTDASSTLDLLPVTLHGDAQDRVVHMYFNRREITEIRKEVFPEPALFEHGVFG